MLRSCDKMTILIWLRVQRVIRAKLILYFPFDIVFASHVSLRSCSVDKLKTSQIPKHCYLFVNSVEASSQPPLASHCPVWQLRVCVCVRVVNVKGAWGDSTCVEQQCSCFFFCYCTALCISALVKLVFEKHKNASKKYIIRTPCTAIV